MDKQALKHQINQCISFILTPLSIKFSVVFQFCQEYWCQPIDCFNYYQINELFLSLSLLGSTFERELFVK